MKCLIIAAGQGTRLRGVGDSKPLVPLLGKPLILRVIETVCSAGVTPVTDGFYIVTGYKADKVKDALVPFPGGEEVTIHVNFIDNDEWEKQNGLSVLKARGFIHEPFFLLMSDHMFDKEILQQLMDYASSVGNRYDVILAVDSRLKDNPLVDIEDVTKVRQEEGNIADIGKTILNYNAFDTGIFYCTPAIFDALSESIEAGDSSLSGGMKVLAAKGKAGVMDIGNSSWIDVDNEEMLKKAEIMLRSKE
ncbi:MAG: NTP transferase domain-containing protein [bacterium]|nr:NTP transferase domain-containing protein [bacterium]